MPANSDTIDNPKKRVKLRVQCSNGYKFIAFVPCEYDYSALKAHIQLQYAKMYPKSPLISVVAMKDAHQFDIPQFDKENRVSDFFQDGDVAFATVEKDNSPHSHTTTVDDNVDCQTSHSNSRSEKQSRKKDKRKQAIISSPAKSTSPNLDNTQISSSGVLEHTNNASVTSAGATSKQHRDGSSKGKMVDSKSDSITEDECENDKDAVKKNLFNEKTASGGSSDAQEPTSKAKPGQNDVNMEDIVDIDDRNSAESTPYTNLHSEQNANTTAQSNTSGDGVHQVSLQIEPANSNNEMNEILPEHSSNPVIQKSKTETSTDVEETGNESSGSDSESESGDDSDDDSVPAEKDKSEVSDSGSDSSAADTSASDSDNNSDDDDDDSADEVTSNQVKAVAQNRSVDPPAKTITTSLPNTTKTSLPAKFDGKTSIFAQHTKPTAVSSKPASQVTTKSTNNAFASLASLASGGKTDLSSNKPTGLGNGTFIANGKSEPKTSLDFTLPAVKFDFNPLKHTNKPSANLASIFATAKANNSEPSNTNNNNKGKKIRKASTLSTRKKPAKKSKLTSLSLSIDSDDNNNNNSDNDIISDTERVVTPKKTAETLYKRQRGTRSNAVNSNSSSAAQSPITTSPPQTNSLPTTAFAETVHQPDGSN